MEPEAVKALVEAALPQCQVEVQGDGSHFEVRAVGEVFAGKSPVQRQRLVYAALGEHIASGAIHAVTIKAHTPEEWQRQSRLQVGGR